MGMLGTSLTSCPITLDSFKLMVRPNYLYVCARRLMSLLTPSCMCVGSQSNAVSNDERASLGA